MPHFLAGVALLALVSQAQDLPTFRSDVSLVHVDAGVLSQDGSAVTGLSRTDFRITEDGVEQEIVAFSAELEPLDLILLLDVSGSMRRSIRKVATTRARAIRELRDGDRVLVMTFNSSSRQIGVLTADRRAIAESMDTVKDVRVSGGTRIEDAVQDAANVFIRLHERERRSRAGDTLVIRRT